MFSVFLGVFVGCNVYGICRGIFKGIFKGDLQCEIAVPGNSFALKSLRDGPGHCRAAAGVLVFKRSSNPKFLARARFNFREIEANLQTCAF